MKKKSKKRNLKILFLIISICSVITILCSATIEITEKVATSDEVVAVKVEIPTIAVEVNSATEKATEANTEPATEKATEEPTEPETKPEILVELSSITSESATAERIHAMFSYFISEGFTPEAAAGIIGNIAIESGYNPSVVSHSGYHGLCQWNTNSGGEYWWYDIQNWMAENGYSDDSFEGQVKAIVNCSNRGQLGESMFEELKNLENVDQATELFTVFYEACPGGCGVTQYYNSGCYYQALDERKSEAWVVYHMYEDQSFEYTGMYG